MGKIDLGGLVVKNSDFSTGLFVPLLEGLELGYCRAFEGERGYYTGPIDLESGSTLFGIEWPPRPTG